MYDSIIDINKTPSVQHTQSQLLGIHISFRMFQAMNGKIGKLEMAHQF